jgi:hypothetical protein
MPWLKLWLTWGVATVGYLMCGLFPDRQGKGRPGQASSLPWTMRFVLWVVLDGKVKTLPYLVCFSADSAGAKVFMPRLKPWLT